jgi:hypothetical protein
MKFDIKWHEKCLVNTKESIARDKEYLERRRIQLEQLSQDALVYEGQIERAKKENKDGFDRDKYGKKR